MPTLFVGLGFFAIGIVLQTIAGAIAVKEEAAASNEANLKALRGDWRGAWKHSAAQHRRMFSDKRRRPWTITALLCMAAGMFIALFGYQLFGPTLP